MDENFELLEYVYQDSEMGVYTLTKLLNELNGKQNKIKKRVEEILKEYEKFFKESKKIIKDSKYSLQGNGLMTKMSASMGIKMESDNDNSDASIAHMIIQGMTMGVVDISTKIKNYKDFVKKDVLNLAKDYLSFQEKQLEELKVYL